MKNSYKIALATLLSLGLLSGAADAALLKGDHAIKDEFLRLEHVFDGLEAHHDYVLSPAPQPGDEITLNAYTLNQIATSFGLDWRTNNPYEDITLTRDATVINAPVIEQTLVDHVLKNTHLTDFKLKLANSREIFVLDSDYSDELEITEFDYDQRRQRFSARIIAQDGQEKMINGLIEKIAQIPVLKNKTRNGDVISRHDIAWIEVPETMLTSDSVTSEAELIGLTPRRYIYEDKIIQKSDLQAPLIVHKGDQVTMTLSTGRLNVTAKGRALDHGAKGDTIRVLNKSSNRVIEAHVTDPMSVSVTANTNDIF